jgi:divalent metal cation (Fe/Co/Zn/Cd) transporter
VELELVTEIDHAVRHVAGVDEMTGTKARWIGHKLRVSVALQVSDTLLLASANAIEAEVRRELADHIPGLEVANVTFSIPTPRDDHSRTAVRLSTPLLNGLLEIADTPRGERVRQRASRRVEGSLRLL